MPIVQRMSVSMVPYRIQIFISVMENRCTSKPIFHVLVVGCGLSGLASALALAQAGHRITVFERSIQLQEVINLYDVFDSRLI